MFINFYFISYFRINQNSLNQKIEFFKKHFLERKLDEEIVLNKYENPKKIIEYDE